MQTEYKNVSFYFLNSHNTHITFKKNNNTQNKINKIKPKCLYSRIERVLRSLHTESEIFICVFSLFFLLFSYSSSFPIKMLATDAKTQKIEPDPNFLRRTKVSEAVCKRRYLTYVFYEVANSYDLTHMSLYDLSKPQ